LDGAQKGGYLHNKVMIYYMPLLEGLFASIALQSLISLNGNAHQLNASFKHKGRKSIYLH